MPSKNTNPPTLKGIPILEVAAALGLEVAGRSACCFNGAAHQSGCDRHPSLVFFPDRGRFQCYACGVKGDAIDLVRAMQGTTFKDAVAWLQSLRGGAVAALSITVARKPARSPEVAAFRVYERLYDLTEPPSSTSPAGVYLRERGLDLTLAGNHGVREIHKMEHVWGTLRHTVDDGARQAAGLFTETNHFLFADHPLLFFYLDGGKPVFVQGRALTQGFEPKEVRPAGLQCPVPYNRDVLRTPLERVFVCEGCIDTLSALQMDYAAVGVPGVQAFREEWFPLFRGARKVSVAFDNDEAGRRQGAELRAQFRMRRFDADYTPPRSGKDVNDVLRLTTKESSNDE